jgi:hypothetical protein
MKPAGPAVRLPINAAIGVVIVLAAVRGVVYAAAASTPFQHTTATTFTLCALIAAAAASMGAWDRAKDGARAAGCGRGRRGGGF